MNELFRRRATIEDSGVAIFEDDHAASFDPEVTRIDGCRDEVRIADVGDKASALIDLELRLFAFLPFRDCNFSAQHSGLDADIRNRLRQGKRSAPGLAIFTRLRWARQPHVVFDLLRRATLVNRRQCETSCKTCGRCAAIYPCEFERDQCEREILRAYEKA